VRRPSAIAIVVALFLVGVAVGIIGSHLYYWHEMRRPGGLASLHAHMVAADLHRYLDLTPDQEGKVDAILADTQRETMAIHHEMRPRILAALQRAHARLDAILTPDQRRRFAEYSRGRGSRMHRLLLDVR
jgi:Spy/CpxP family protein refolding chaperone